MVLSQFTAEYKLSPLLQSYNDSQTSDPDIQQTQGIWRVARWSAVLGVKPAQRPRQIQPCYEHVQWEKQRERERERERVRLTSPVVWSSSAFGAAVDRDNWGDDGDSNCHIWRADADCGSSYTSHIWQCQSVNLSIYLSLDRSISIHPSIDRSIDRSIYLSIYLSIYRSFDRSIVYIHR